MMDALERLVRQVEEEPSLLEPDRLRERLEALDRLDAYLAFLPDVPDAPDVPDVPEAVLGVESKDAELSLRARAVCARLEAANGELYEAIRGEIQRGRGADALLRWVHSQERDAGGGAGNSVGGGVGYDYLDEMVSGVLQFEEPDAGDVAREPEMVFYQPTPARHIFDFIGVAGLTAEDVVVDLGSGLGHVPLLVSICTGASSVGIELEAAYVERARQCAQRLNVKKATFLCEDARVADLSRGTVFYLYTPFVGAILRDVLERLKREAAGRRIRVCTYGPCTAVVAEETWLEAVAAPEMDRIVLFRSRD